MSDTEQPTNPSRSASGRGSRCAGRNETGRSEAAQAREAASGLAKTVPGGKSPREKPEFKPGPPPNLEGEYRASAPSLRDLDQQIEQDLEAAMGGMSGTELYGDLSEKPARQPAGEPGPKKGRVLRIHGPDVFVEVPGGRSQGVLPMTQFPDGPPEIGTEVDIHIEGYDPANGLLDPDAQGRGGRRPTGPASPRA